MHSKVLLDILRRQKVNQAKCRFYMFFTTYATCMTAGQEVALLEHIVAQ
jgi:hypothetical protein